MAICVRVCVCVDVWGKCLGCMALFLNFYRVYSFSSVLKYMESIGKDKRKSVNWECSQRRQSRRNYKKNYYYIHRHYIDIDIQLCFRVSVYVFRGGQDLPYLDYTKSTEGGVRKRGIRIYR